MPFGTLNPGEFDSQDYVRKLPSYIPYIYRIVETHCCISSITCPTLPASTALPHIAGALDLAFFRSRTSEGCCTAMVPGVKKQATSSQKMDFYI